MHKNMRQLEMIKAIKHILEFWKAFDLHKIDNIFVIMWDPHLKTLWVVKNYGTYGNAICLALKYDGRTFILFLLLDFVNFTLSPMNG